MENEECKVRVVGERLDLFLQKYIYEDSIFLFNRCDYTFKV